MDRLTIIGDDGYVYRANSMISDADTWRRLSAYENTELEPEEIRSLVAEWSACKVALDSYRELGSLDHLRNLLAAERDGRLAVLPCKQYKTVYYILDNRVYTGWYLAKVGETTHLILQDKIEMGICWVADGFWFLAKEEAAAALKEARNETN